MITRIHTALALCVCVTGCVSAYNPPPPTTPPHSASRPPATPSTPSATSGSSGQAGSHTPQEAQGPKPATSTKPDEASEADEKDPAKRKIEHLEVAIQGKSQSPLVGKVELTDLPNGVKVVVLVDRLEPGLHGVHIHEFADCSAKDATSAGQHFNPDDKPHGLPSEGKKHLGDLGNIVAKAPDGSGRLEIVVPGANLSQGGPKSFLNHSLVVHADYDDGKKQPGGNSGKRIGCAELTIAAAKAQPEGRVVWRQ